MSSCTVLIASELGDTERSTQLTGSSETPMIHPQRSMCDKGQIDSKITVPAAQGRIAHCDMIGDSSRAGRLAPVSQSSAVPAHLECALPILDILLRYLADG